MIDVTELVAWLRRQLDADEEHVDLAADIMRQRPTTAFYADQMRPNIEAKRRILDEIARWSHAASGDGWYSCSQATEDNGFPIDMACFDEDRAGKPCDCGLDGRRARLLTALALPYADRDGYRQEWAP